MTISVAVIGSGMAGLAAAHGCRKAGYRVTVFEAQQGHGMDAHALPVQGGLVDVPLRVMSVGAWQSVLALAEEVGVGTFKVDTFTACSWRDQQTWFRSGRLPVLGWPFVGSWRFLDRKALRMARGLAQLSRLTASLAAGGDERTLAQVLADQPFDPLFWRGLVLPLLTTICTCDESHLLEWPAAQLLSLLDGILHGGELRRLQGGTTALVEGLAKDLPCISGSPVRQVSIVTADNGGSQVEVRNGRDEGGLFDRVIVATQANQLDFLDSQQFAEERAVLAAIRFDQGELWVHQDQRFLPRQQRDWSALNFQMDRDMKRPMFSVLVNHVEPSLTDAAPVLQTWNPLFEPRAETVLARVPLQRAVVHRGTAAVHQQLQQWHQQPQRQVFFCGSWAHDGVPLLESAVRSANGVLSALQQQQRAYGTAS